MKIMDFPRKSIEIWIWFPKVKSEKVKNEEWKSEKWKVRIIFENNSK